MNSYDELGSCNKCGGMNNEVVEVVAIDGGYVSECTTKCRDCGFEDYWAYGHFESGTEMKGKSKKYCN